MYTAPPLHPTARAETGAAVRNAALTAVGGGAGAWLEERRSLPAAEESGLLSSPRPELLPVLKTKQLPRRIAPPAFFSWRH
eukprot:1551708-Pyramimonas_sp.AAC.1